MNQEERIKVIIRCNQCGEKFILRGKLIKGQPQTGFKRCICSNSDDLDITTQAI